VVWPLTVGIPMALRRGFAGAGWAPGRLLESALAVAIISPAMVYLMMPLTTRALSQWLKR
jgi:antibiotic biosynthesis monooxygenase (ABM) superfamily enzyme